MSQFLRLLGGDIDKAAALRDVCDALRRGRVDQRLFEVDAQSFDAVPGKPFSYWVSDEVRSSFAMFRPFEGEGRTAKVGMATADDFRFLRAWWEPVPQSAPTNRSYPPFAKGGGFSQYYSDIPLVLSWNDNGRELKQTVIQQHGNAGKRIYNEDFFFLPAITWPLRAHRFSPQALPAECIFSVRGYTAHFPTGTELASLALMGSSAFDYFFKAALGRFGYPEFIVGTLQFLPWPGMGNFAERLTELARRAWSIRRSLDTVNETSHAFHLPQTIQDRSGKFQPQSLRDEFERIQVEVDCFVFELYKFSPQDKAAALQKNIQKENIEVNSNDESDDVEIEESSPTLEPAVVIYDAVSWATGVVFGRFDLKLATGERVAPPEPEPFDPLPAKSPGMLPDGATPFHIHAGVVVDDAGHAHDLARLVEDVLARVGVPEPSDLRSWMQKDFFAFHLQRYSKSRRKAPVYWPLATASGDYTLWLYYPSLNSQTLYTAINDFLDGPNGKLKQVASDVTALRNKGSARTRDEEKRFENLEGLELELIELRDQLLKIAPTYKPNHDDGVQITAAPLWPLFRHKPWQKILKDTWTKLEKGDYDWAHLAMNYWPDRVREKCKTDKSLAIAHGLEALYVEPPPKAAATRGRKAKEA